MTLVRLTIAGLLISMLTTAALHAQTPAPAASGKVVEPSGQPAGGLPLQVQGPAGKTVVFTDTQGQWSLYNLPAGTYKVTPLTKPMASQQPVEFLIKDKGVVDKLFGGTAPTYSASDIKLK